MKDFKTYEIIHYLKMHLDENNLSYLYKSLQDAIKNYIQHRSSDNYVAIHEIKADITKCNNILDLDQFGILGKKIASELDIYNFLGIEANIKLDEIVTKSPNVLLDTIQNYISKFTTAERELAKLDKIFSEIRLAKYNEYKLTKTNPFSILSLKFDNDISINSIENLVKNVDKWRTVFHSFNRLCNQENVESDTEIYSVEEGSLILNVTLFISTLTAILKVTEKYYQVRIEREKFLQATSQTALFQGLSEALIDQIKNEKQSYLETIKSNILEELFNQFYNNNTSENVNELKNAVGKSVETVTEFIDKGGKIDILDANYQDLLQNPNLEIEDIKNTVGQIQAQQKELKILKEDKKAQALIAEHTQHTNNAVS